MTSSSRRKFLKVMGYSAVAVSAGTAAASSAVATMVTPQPTAMAQGSALPTCDITIYQQSNMGRENITLMNLTGETVTLDKINPVGLENVNGSLAVRLNNVAGGEVKLQLGERLSFEVEAISKGSVDERWQIPNVVVGHVSIRSDHPDFNGVIPVTVFDSQVA
uniref:Twin-arginine translocation signal domain-containing protein n=1 Tax=uncultured Thiotrichaceae bacterium TaxID=298394 RepID=A0A6S6UKA4_9GAMM|nr:MAG: Unknown protein [uncultured Thiotrichaceae bacterium]